MPYWRLSSFYFWYFAFLGALYPYWSLYFQWLGLTAGDIGLLMGAMMASKVIAPNIWAWVADRSGRRLTVMRLGSLLALVLFCGLFVSEHFYGLLLVITGFSFFWNAVLPQQEAITLSFLAARPERYSLVRLWGSMGFIVTVVLAGALLKGENIAALPLLGALLLALIWLSSLTIPEARPIARRAAANGFWRLLGRKPVVAFLVGGLLMQVGHGAYYSFFSIHLQGLGYSEFAIGLIWALGVVAEVLVFLLMHSLLPRFGVKFLLLASLLLAAIRWLLIGHFADHLWWLLVAQSFHAFTFGTFHSAAIEGVRRTFSREHQSKGQALYSATSFGLGGAVGSIAAGQLWGLGAALTFDMAALVSVAGLLVIAFWYRIDPDNE